MFVPSFFTGAWIARFGVLRIIVSGAAMMALCAGVNLMGTSLLHFQVALVLLGIGWILLAGLLAESALIHAAAG